MSGGGGPASLPCDAPGESCQWKAGLKTEGPATSYSYSTCSTDTSTCNDGECDALERAEDSLCPQDCVGKGKTRIKMFQTIIMNIDKVRMGFLVNFSPTGEGIHSVVSANMSCRCDVFSCQCLHAKYAVTEPQHRQRELPGIAKVLKILFV